MLKLSRLGGCRSTAELGHPGLCQDSRRFGIEIDGGHYRAGAIDDAVVRPTASDKMRRALGKHRQAGEAAVIDRDPHCKTLCCNCSLLYSVKSLNGSTSGAWQEQVGSA